MLSRSALSINALRLFVHLVAPFKSSERITILNYHRVTKRPARFDEYSISAKDFDWQMRLLSRIFNVISIDDAVAFLEGGTIPKRAVVLTFDDGYLDNLTEALPILKKYNLPATIYVAGDAIRSGLIWNEEVCRVVMHSHKSTLDASELGLGELCIVSEQDKKVSIERCIELLKNQRPDCRDDYLQKLYQLSGTAPGERYMLSEKDVAELTREPLITVGCHTMYHPMMSYISTDSAKADIQESLDYIKSALGYEMTHFAYPYGKYGKDFHAEHLNCVANMNFRSAVTTDWGAVKQNSSFYMMKRYTPWSDNLLRYFISLCRNYTS